MDSNVLLVPLTCDAAANILVRASWCRCAGMPLLPPAPRTLSEKALVCRASVPSTLQDVSNCSLEEIHQFTFPSSCVSFHSFIYSPNV